jgi:hypothetical protein
METQKESPITVGMKIALGLMFFPVLYFVAAVCWHQLPYPTLFVNFQTLKPTPYYLFMSNTPENFPGAIIFVLACICVGTLLILRSDIRWTDFWHEFAHDVFHARQTETTSAPTTTKTEHTDQKPWYQPFTRTPTSQRVPETSP